MRTEQSFTAGVMLSRGELPLTRKAAGDIGSGPVADCGESSLKRQGLLHDARNLLAAIELYCDLLSMPDVLRPEHRKYPEELRLLGRRSSDLLSQLMKAGPGFGSEMAAMQHTGPRRRKLTPSVESRKAPVSLRAIVGASSGLLSRVAAGCTIEFRYGPAAALPIGADVEAVERILLNLVRNAAHATQVSGASNADGEASMLRGPGRRNAARRPGTIRVTVGQLPDAGLDRSPWPFQRVGLVVEDNGCGMAPEQVQRLLHGTGGAPGQMHGIGFRVVRELVAQSCGELRLMTEPGVGTRVQIQWPVWFASEGKPEPARLSEAGAPEFSQASSVAAGIIDGGAREPLPVQSESQQGVFVMSSFNPDLSRARTIADRAHGSTGSTVLDREAIAPALSAIIPTNSDATLQAETWRSGVQRLPETMPGLRLLVVDDDSSLRKACCEIAAGMGFEADSAGSVQEALNLLQQHPVDMVLLDLKLPGGGGLHLLGEVKRLYPKIGVVVMTAFATVASAVEAMRTGAGDYLTKPFALDELTNVLGKGARRLHFDTQSRQLREKLRTQRGMGDLIGTSPAMEKVYRILTKVAFSAHPVLILGESGTGKEVVAQSIHSSGPNAAKPFIPVDCSSLVPTLIESELFGHVKGAFTGAIRAKEGLLAAADGGTVFLDEIGELPLDLQAKLLRALQEKEVRPVGATHAVPISARILAATNRDLIAMIAQGQFRKDLYFRLNVVNLKIPPLRERREDIPVLAEYFLERVERESGQTHQFSEDAMRLLLDYDWPGNVRELQHAIERTCAMSSGPVLHTVDLPTQLQDFSNHLRLEGAQAQDGASLAAEGEGGASSAVVSIADMEKQAILGALRQLNGDKLMAARLLGIGKTTLYRKLKEYGVAETGDFGGN